MPDFSAECIKYNFGWSSDTSPPETSEFSPYPLLNLERKGGRKEKVEMKTKTRKRSWDGS